MLFFCVSLYGCTILWTIIRHEWIKRSKISSYDGYIFWNCLYLINIVYRNIFNWYWYNYSILLCLSLVANCCSKYFWNNILVSTTILICLLDAYLCWLLQWFVTNILTCDKWNSSLSINGMAVEHLYPEWQASNCSMTGYLNIMGF